MKKIILILLGLMIVAAITCEAQKVNNTRVTDDYCKEVYTSLVNLEQKITQLEVTINSLPIYEIDTVYPDFNTRTQSVFVGDTLHRTSDYMFKTFDHDKIKYNIIISEKELNPVYPSYNMIIDTDCYWWDEYLTVNEQDRILNIEQLYNAIPPDYPKSMQQLMQECYIGEMIRVVMRGYMEAEEIYEYYE